MELKGQIIITGIKKKTGAKFFESLKIGDVIELRYNLDSADKYAPHIYLYKGGVKIMSTYALQVKTNLSNFEYVEV